MSDTCLDTDTLKVKGWKRCTVQKLTRKKFATILLKSETTEFTRKCLSKKPHDGIRLNRPWREQGHNWIQLIKTSKHMQEIIELWREMGTL